MPQMIYESNVDYEASYERANGHPKVKMVDQTQKGLIIIELKNLEKTKVLVSPSGSIQVFYSTDRELENVLKVLRKILVPRQGENLLLEESRRIRTLTETDVWIKENLTVKDEVIAIVKDRKGKIVQISRGKD